MSKRYTVLLVMMLSVLFALGFTWGDPLARQMRKGNEAFEAGQYEEALQAYTEADVSSRAGDPRLPRLYNNMGAALAAQGLYDQAEAMYQKALEASQESGMKADALFNAGNSRLKQNNLQGALDAYTQSLKENPQHRQALYNKQVVEQLIEQQKQQQKQQQEKEQQQQQQNQKQSNDQSQDGQPQDEQPQNDGQPTPQPTPSATPAEQQKPPDPGEQEQQEAQAAEQGDEQPEQDLSEEEALRILDALMEKERLHQEQRRVPPRPVEKDW